MENGRSYYISEKGDDSNDGLSTEKPIASINALNKLKLHTGDVVYFGLCEPNQKFEHAILKKVFRYDDWRLCNKCCELEFSTEDTENLLPGNYYYEVKLYREKDPNCHNNESVTTVVPKTKFTILE